jgi:hypothetical protein
MEHRKFSVVGPVQDQAVAVHDVGELPTTDLEEGLALVGADAGPDSVDGGGYPRLQSHNIVPSTVRVPSSQAGQAALPSSRSAAESQTTDFLHSEQLGR